MSKMPLLEYVKSCHPCVSLEKVLLIGCQHILATTHLMLRALCQIGLDPKNIFILGKCYSSNRSVFLEMRKDGIQVSDLSFSFESREAFDKQFCRYNEKFLKQTLSNIDLSKFEKIVLLDDGGQLLMLATDYFKDFTNIIGIEQTTSGYEKIKSIKSHFPIINVARSQAKLIYESPFIAEAVIKKTLKCIDALRRDPKEILIIGHGVIGSSIYKALRGNYRIRIYDKVLDEKSKLDEYLRTADLVIGCTGETSLPIHKHKFLKRGCILLSASSSDREFDAVHLRKKVLNLKNCHTDLDVNGKILLNCGFPVNFDGCRNSVTPAKIQLTRALLMSAILQACETSDCNPEIIPLDIEIQREVVNKFLKLQSAWLPNHTPNAKLQERKAAFVHRSV